MHMGRTSGTNVYIRVGIARDIYERMGAWRAYADSGTKRTVTRYERESCDDLARAVGDEMRRVLDSPRCCSGVSARAQPARR